MAPIEIAEVKTRIFTEGREYVLDAAFWPQCGFEFPPHGGGPANQEVQSAVMGTKGTGVNLVFATTVAPTSTSPPSRVLVSSTICGYVRNRHLATTTPAGQPRRRDSTRVGENVRVAAYTVNEEAIRHAKQLIDARQYVLRSRWQDVQPRAKEKNAFLKTHSWEEYASWHLGLTEGAAEETKARYAFVYGDLRRLHRMGLIACHYRAAEWRHKEIELAAHKLLQYLDRKTAG